MDCAKERDVVLDIAKGIGIILMVIGHSGCPKLLCDFIYLFHMPLFFLISGYIARKHINNVGRYGNWLPHKVKQLYLPFVILSFVLLLSHNMLYDLHLESVPYTSRNFIIKVVEIPLLLGSDSLIAGFWFVGCLFYSILLTCGIRYMLRNVTSRINISIVCLVIFTIMFEISLQMRKVLLGSCVAYDFFSDFAVSLFGGATFFSIGVSLASYKFLVTNNVLFVIVGLMILIVVAMLYPIYRPYDSIIWGGYVIIMGVIGTMVPLYLSIKIQNSNLGMILSGIGRHTFLILTLHLLAFKLVSVGYVWVKKLDTTAIADYPVIEKFARNGGWILYSAIGVSLPCACGYFFNKRRKRDLSDNF